MDDTHDFFDDMERLMDVPHRSFMNVASGYWSPPTDIFDTETEILVIVEIAGMNKKDIELTYDKGFLAISGVRKHICPASVNAIYRMEINSGRFLRKIRIDIDIVVEDIEAEYRDGLLRITIPKRADNG